MQDPLKLMQERQSARAPFDPDRKIAPVDMIKILEAARWAPSAHNMQNFQIIVVDDRQALESLSQVRTGGIDQIFLRENYAQLSFSVDELKRKKVGVLAAMFPPSWRTPGMKPDPQEVEAHSFLGDPVRKSAALLLVLYDPGRRAPASEGDFLGVMSLGCVMENMWLMAQSLGIGLQIQSALGAGTAEGNIKRLLGIPESLRIAFAARLGYPTAPVSYLRVRRDLEDFVHHNRFGERLRGGPT